MSLLSSVLCGLLCAIALIAAILLLSYLKRRTQKKYRDFVVKNSTGVKQLDEINSRYTFYPYVSFDQSHTYDNQVFFDMISCQDYLIYQLRFIKKNVFDQIKKVRFNSSLYPKYLAEVNAVTSGRFETPIGKLKPEKLAEVESASMKDRTYTPATRFDITVTLYNSTVNGRIYGKKSVTFSVDDILALNRRLNNKSGNFYRDREIWDAICRVERGKVSNKMRFAIYKRDGYMCRKCGISGRYAPLEIDHIIPIAKGGKSTYNNLQTLCHKCNAEKGDTLEY